MELMFPHRRGRGREALQGGPAGVAAQAGSIGLCPEGQQWGLGDRRPLTYRNEYDVS